MVIRNPSLNWEKLQNVFYRNRKLCNLQWPVEQEVNYAISTTVLAIELNDSLQIFDYEGKMVVSVDKSQFSAVIKFEFDDEERLVIATPHSLIIADQLRPLQLRTIPLDDIVEDTIWDYQGGILIMQQSQNIYRLNQNKISLLMKNEGQYTLLTKDHWNSNGKKVLLLDIHHVFELSFDKKELTKILADSHWHRVILSPNNFICLYNIKFNKLQVFKNPSRVLLEHTLEETPKCIKWCGDDSIACIFKDEVKVYGPGNSYIVFWFPQEVAAVRTEIDGLKVFTTTDVNFISRVANHTSNAFRIGSTEPSAILLDSVNLLEENITRSIENLKIIDLKQAVLDCIEASKEEFDPQLQKKLLSAASFGKSSLSIDEFDSDIFVKACDLLRLLGLLQGFCIYVTLRQFNKITLTGLVSRLLRQQEHYKCILICQMARDNSLLPSIFTNWSTAKIRMSKDLDDDELYLAIKSQFDSLPSYTKSHVFEISNIASLEGRFGLSRKLALLEYSPELKISQLLQLDEDNLALKESLKIYCPELTTSLLLNLRQKLTSAQLAKLLILDMPRDQLYPYIFRTDYGLLYDYYQQTDRFVDLAHLLLLQSKDSDSIRTFLPQVQELYSKFLNDSLIKQDAELIQRQERLWSFQETLTSSLGTNFVGRSLDETLQTLAEMKQEKQLQSLVKKFKVSDKKWYHIKIRALVGKKLFEELYHFAINKKSPIGYIPFYKYLVKKGYNGEASIYVSMISSVSYEEKIEMYLKCKAYQEAIQLAGKEKDVQGLKAIYKKIPPNETQLKSLVNEFMNKI